MALLGIGRAIFVCLNLQAEKYRSDVDEQAVICDVPGQIIQVQLSSAHIWTHLPKQILLPKQ